MTNIGDRSLSLFKFESEKMLILIHKIEQPLIVLENEGKYQVTSESGEEFDNHYLIQEVQEADLIKLKELIDFQLT